MRWYNKIVGAGADPAALSDAIEYFLREYGEAVTEVKQLHGKRLIEAQAMIPGIAGYRLEQKGEVESIRDYLDIQIDALQGEKRRHYIEHYNRSLGERMVEKYSETDCDVIRLRELRNHIEAVRHKFAALARHHEFLHYQLGNISKLKAAAAGIPDAVMALDLVNTPL